MPTGLLINLVIVFIVFISIFRGWTIGLVRQLFSAIGFFGGLFLGAYLEHWVVNFGHSNISRTVYTLLCTLGLAFIFLTIGELIGNYLKRHITFKNINILDNILGSLVSIVTMIVSIWLTAAVLSSISIAGLSSFINSSSIIRTLNKTFPDAPGIIEKLGSIIDPNGFPKVFIGNEPSINNNVSLPNLASFKSAISEDQKSVVKVEGLGCGGMVEGSGFVVSHDLIATNAHVVAGIRQIYIYDSNGSRLATPVYFNPNLDLAILRVNNLNLKPIKIDPNILNNGTDAIVIGYPGGGPLSIKPAVILDDLNAVGLNIYGQGNVTRSVYELKADVIPGNSGGPLIEENGNVNGVVFAQSTTYNEVGYALTANQIIKPINQSKYSYTPVSTRGCAE